MNRRFVFVFSAAVSLVAAVQYRMSRSGRNARSYSPFVSQFSGGSPTSRAAIFAIGRRFSCFPPDESAAILAINFDLFLKTDR
jgi:hypothetical protein